MKKATTKTKTQPPAPNHATTEKEWVSQAFGLLNRLKVMSQEIGQFLSDTEELDQDGPLEWITHALTCIREMMEARIEICPLDFPKFMLLPSQAKAAKEV